MKTGPGKRQPTHGFWLISGTENYFDDPRALSFPDFNVFEYASFLPGKKCSTTLVEHGAVDILLKILKKDVSESSVIEEILVLVHSILARIAPKGKNIV